MLGDLWTLIGLCHEIAPEPLRDHQAALASQHMNCTCRLAGRSVDSERAGPAWQHPGLDATGAPRHLAMPQAQSCPCRCVLGVTAALHMNLCIMQAKSQLHL